MEVAAQEALKKPPQESIQKKNLLNAKKSTQVNSRPLATANIPALANIPVYRFWRAQTGR
ncbi:hypothetical protein HPB48_006276 [Haemaphysalis longicornis]|uniref:Uncharacterized protein n=1 Tax=Haemaphysalis longicornis TaxID=44386 RepID=A0A9J6G5Z2_HAELO|nr:hypothetical protein HPB48_006276 [Haemaphysalis longicornis]